MSPLVSRRALAALGVLIPVGVLTPAGDARAFECKRSDLAPSVSLTWPERTIRFGVVPASGLELEPVRAAARAWSQVACSDLEIELLGAVPEDALPEASLVVVDEGWVAGDERGARPREAVGLTTTIYERFTGDIVEGQVEINRESFAIGEAESCRPAAPELYDLQAVLTHEIGHLLGLAHTEVRAEDGQEPTMAPTIARCELGKRSLEADDRLALCTLYPRGAPNGGCPSPLGPPGTIRNRTFGCRASEGSGGSWLVLVALVALAGRGGRSCPRTRSAR